MLTALRIANFALIDCLSLEFSSGLQILTGESGAGKSIIIDAIALIIGGRGSVDQIRADADEAVLEAVFALPAGGTLTAQCRDLGLLGSGQTELVIRRIVSREGRHRVFVNGNATPLHAIQRLAGTLIDIHGQYEHQSLLSSGVQLEALDAFGRLSPLRQEYRMQYDRWRAGCQELEAAERTAEERHAREDFLRFQHRELMEGELRPGELESLTAEHRRLVHARRLAELQHETYGVLYEQDTSILTQLGVLLDRLGELESIDPDVQEWSGLCRTAAAQLGEVAHGLRTYRDRLDQDPDRLAQVEDRLDRLQRLQRKYGASIEALMAKAEEVQRELEVWASSESRVADLRECVGRDFERLMDLGRRLSESRSHAAATMTRKVQAELTTLHMDRTRFLIRIRTTEKDPGPAGMNQVDYLLSSEGEPFQALAHVASGGELSRIMLAIKTVLAASDAVPVLVFDEIDAGVGGAVAAVMGRRLRALARFHQVFCITHLPQIASQADVHYVVRKETVHKRTITRVSRLDLAGRREELARMLGGLAVTKAARERAAEMLIEAGREVT